MKKTLLAIILFSCLLAGFFSAPVFAETDNGAGQAIEQMEAAGGEQGAKYVSKNVRPRDPREVAALIIRILMGFLGVVFLAYLVYAGFLLITSGGQEEKITKARHILFYGVIGALITFSSYGLALLVERYIGEATGGSQPDSLFYAGGEFKVDKDTSEFYDPDPLGGSAHIIDNIWGDSEGTTW